MSQVFTRYRMLSSKSAGSIGNNLPARSAPVYG